MAIDENLEERVAQNRGRTRQNKTTPWLIRDDGMLMPNVPGIAKKNNYRPYHGALDATLEQRMEYLRGFGGRQRRAVVASAPVEVEPLDISKATKAELIAFAEEEFGYTIDPDDHLNKVRSAVAKLAGVDPKAAQGQKPKAETAEAGG